MLTFHTLIWEFSLWEFSVCWSVCWNSQKSVYYCLVITLWKCEYCLIWALNKSILFGSNYLKELVLSDTNSEKRFYYSLIWKDKCAVLFASNSENVSIAWCLKKCVVLFGSNSIKVPVMFDMNSENVFTLVW